LTFSYLFSFPTIGSFIHILFPILFSIDFSFDKGPILDWLNVLEAHRAAPLASLFLSTSASALKVWTSLAQKFWIT
jgi:hypothetical protein